MTHAKWCSNNGKFVQAHYPLIQRVESAEVANGTATQAGGPNRYLLQANYTGASRPMLQIHLLLKSSHGGKTLASYYITLTRSHGFQHVRSVGQMYHSVVDIIIAYWPFVIQA